MKTLAHVAFAVPGPSYTGPWMGWFSGFTGWLLATCLFIVAIIIIVGLMYWAWGKVDSSQRAQSNGLITVVMGAVAAAVIGTAGSAIAWASDLGPEWMNF